MLMLMYVKYLNKFVTRNMRFKSYAATIVQPPLKLNLSLNRLLTVAKLKL